MKRVLFLFLFVLLLQYFFVPEYRELNNLVVIDKIRVLKKEEGYTISLREVVPKRENNGIQYSYEYYHYQVARLEDFYQDMRQKKRFYFRKVKSLSSNMNTDEFRYRLNLHPKTIYHYSTTGVFGVSVTSSTGCDISSVGTSASTVLSESVQLNPNSS